MVGWMLDVMDGDPKWAFWMISFVGIPISLWLFRFEAVLGDKKVQKTFLSIKQKVNANWIAWLRADGLIRGDIVDGSLAASGLCGGRGQRRRIFDNLCGGDRIVIRV